MADVYFNVRQLHRYSGHKVLDGNNYTVSIYWIELTAKWYMDIKGINNNIDQKNIPLLTGKDLLAKYGYNELGQLWVIDNQDLNEDPTFEEMGGRFKVKYVTI